MSHASLTILQLTHQGDGAGSTQSILNLSQHLQRRGHRVLLGCRAESLLARLGRDAGLGSVPLEFSRLAPLARRLAEVIARERVDIVNSHATRDRRALTWLRWRGGLPQALVVTRRTMPLTSPLELFAIGHAADRTVAVSEAVARTLRRRWHPGARLRVVPNGIDVARMDASAPPPERAAARAALDAGERPVILVVARRKDQDVLLRALASLAPPVVLACVGVEPHAQLEAMALGLPVVASDAGGNPDLIAPDTGVLVPPLDPAAWAAALARLIADPAARARLGAAARARVRRDFTLEHTAEQTEVVYREALQRRRLLRGERPR